MKSIIFILSLLISINSLAFDDLINDANAEQGQERRHGKRGEMFKKLRLSDEQKTQFKEIRSKYKPQMKENRQKLKTLKEDFHSMMKSNDKSEGFRSNLLSKFDELQQLKTQNKRTRIEMALDIRELLTSEQISKFQEMRKKKKGNGRFRGRRGHGSRGK